MILERFPEIRKLPTEELAQLKWEIDTLLGGFVDEEVTDPEILKLLQERHAHYLQNPETARPAEEVLAELRAQYITPRRA